MNCVTCFSCVFILILFTEQTWQLTMSFDCIILLDFTLLPYDTFNRPYPQSLLISLSSRTLKCTPAFSCVYPSFGVMNLKTLNKD